MPLRKLSLERLNSMFEDKESIKTGKLQSFEEIDLLLKDIKIKELKEPQKFNGMNSVQFATTKIDPAYSVVLEFGVWKGDSLRLIREELDPVKYHVCAFDSFEGLPEDWTNTELKKGFFSTGGIIPPIEDVKFYKGWFKNTIPKYLKDIEANTEIEDKTIALLHVDCDLYSSTKTIFKYLHPYIKKGTIIVFDDWFYHGEEIAPYQNKKYADGEQKAFYEYVVKNAISWEFIPFMDHQNLYERKIVRIL